MRYSQENFSIDALRTVRHRAMITQLVLCVLDSFMLARVTGRDSVTRVNY